MAPLRFGPMRCKFGATPASELQLRGVLDVAVSPTALLEAVSARFKAAGGLVLENSPVREVRIDADYSPPCLEETLTTCAPPLCVQSRTHYIE